MKNDFIKFISNKSASFNYEKHWQFCIENKIPFIRIIQSGQKYWQIEYDAFPITMLKRFTVIDYADHIIPLYKLYASYNHLPSNKFSVAGGGRNLIFTVFKKDANDIAEKIFDLLLLLSKRDQELFDENPFTLNSEGFNSEGVQVEGYKAFLSTESDKALLALYKMMKKDNPHHLQTIALIKNEIDRRG